MYADVCNVLFVTLNKSETYKVNVRIYVTYSYEYCLRNMCVGCPPPIPTGAGRDCPMPMQPGGGLAGSWKVLLGHLDFKIRFSYGKAFLPKVARNGGGQCN